MADKIKIIQDISLLFELSLSVGTTLDPVENCHHFLQTLISRKSLSFGSVWLLRDPGSLPHIADLFYIHPNFRIENKSIVCNSFISQQLEERPYLSICSKDPHFQEIIHEKNVEKGAYAIFRLGDVGFLKLFASNRQDGFSEMEMAQLKQVVDKLKVSLDGCFAHIRLKKETESRIVAQNALEENEKKLRRIIDSSLDAVASVDDDGNIIEWNVQAERMFGYSRGEAMGQKLRDLIIPERHRNLYRLSLREQMQVIDATNINRRYEIKCRRKNGDEFRAEISIAADKGDSNTLFVSFIRDITEQLKAQAEVERSRIRMETLITNLQAGVLLEDENRKIVLVNKAFCDLFQIPAAPSEIIGADCSAAAENSKALFRYPEAFVSGIDKRLKEKVLTESEVLHMADGRTLERDFIPLFSNNQYQGHLWQYRDVTERQNAERAIRESEEKYRGILENMELGLLEVDKDETIVRANNAFCKMTGYSLDELVGKNAPTALLPVAMHAIMAERIEERNRGIASVYENQIIRKDGTIMWGLVSGAPVRNSQGVIIGSIGIHFDLTHRKRLETELAEATHVADRARLAERQFLTNMSHEIRTPINAVIGMTHLLYETNPSATQKEYLDSLRFSADTLLSIVDNILDLSKIDAGEIEFEDRPFDLNYLVQSVVRTFQYKLGGKNLNIVEHSDSRIENLVVGDPTRLNQILTNLMGNALKFTEKGQIEIRTELLRHVDGKYMVEFSVRDTGIGIPEDKWETIFENFKQANIQINRKFGGTGLGLTIVKQLVELQGGNIRVESKEGVGSKFVFQLPFGDSLTAANSLDLKLEAPSGAQNTKIIGLDFLIVEDNAMNQKLICKTIQIWGCTFQVANNGIEALKKTAHHKFDAILMDIHMPEMDGCETTLAIRSDNTNPNKDVPIIALTAAAMPEEKRRAIEVGMNGFLTKPFSPKTLQDQILRFMQELKLREISEPNAQLLPKTEELIDLTYLMDLSGGDKSFVHNIVETFLNETPAMLTNMELLMGLAEWDQVGKIAHKLKPNFAMLGMKGLHEMTLKLESLIKATPRDSVAITNMSRRLIKETNKIFPALGQKVNSI